MSNFAAVLINAGCLLLVARLQGPLLPSRPIVCQISLAHRFYGHKAVQWNYIRQLP